jgi:hypothetical protein
MRDLEDPGLSESSLSFIALPSRAIDNTDKMRDFRNHATDCGRILDGRTTPNFIKTEAD